MKRIQGPEQAHVDAVVVVEVTPNLLAPNEEI